MVMKCGLFLPLVFEATLVPLVAKSLLEVDAKSGIRGNFDVRKRTSLPFRTISPDEMSAEN